MKPARIMLLLIAIVAGGLAAFLATRGSGPATVVHEASAPQPQLATKVLVAKEAIGVGERLSPGAVEWQPWPDNAVRPEYITIAKSPDAAAKIGGAVARFEIFAGEPILDKKLVRSDQGYLSAALEPGMRGVSVEVSAASGAGGFIIPNDRVDVVVTDTSGGQTVSRVVLNNVKVLAIGNRLGQSGSTGAPPTPNDPKSQVFTNQAIATLELTPAEGDALINATARGKISLVLRSVADFAKTGNSANAAQDNQTVKVIRFGRELSVMPGTDSQNTQASVSPAAFVAPQISVAPPLSGAAATIAAPTVTPPDASAPLPAPVQ